jgi:hypothetical protein
MTREDVEALRAVYPRVYQEVVKRVLADLGTVEKLPPYHERLSLGLLLGAPTDPSLEPDFIQSMQRGTQPPEPQEGGAVLAPSRRSPPEVSKLHQTKNDRILGAT